MKTTSKTKVSSTDLTSDRKLFSIENSVEKANPLNSIIADTVDGHMVTGPEQQSRVHYPVP